MTEKLSEEEIKERLDDLKIWGIEQNRLVTKIEFENYKESTFFANTVFSLSEAAFHHPRVVVEYNSVSIDLWTHEVEGITEKDFELAKEIEDKVREIDWE